MRITIEKNRHSEEEVLRISIRKSGVKKIKLACIAMLFFLFFWAGYQCSARIDMNKKKEQIEILKSYMKERDEGWEQMPGLNEADARFLEEHLYGIWGFDQRLIALGEAGCTGDFSKQGTNELEEVLIIYEDDFVDRKGYGKNTFSNVKDVFLFAEYGGNSMVNEPVYHVDRNVDENRIILQNILEKENALPVPFPENIQLVKVSFDLGYDTALCPAVDTNLFGSNIYVNPDDADTIYMDFGGLWRLERKGERGSWSTAGKNER